MEEVFDGDLIEHWGFSGFGVRVVSKRMMVERWNVLGTAMALVFQRFCFGFVRDDGMIMTMTIPYTLAETDRRRLEDGSLGLRYMGDGIGAVFF